MMDAVTTLISPTSMAVTTLLMGCIIVVVEAVRGSKEAFWGDMFSEELDD
ncbi:MAG: hypothetical protein ACRBEQ_10580 [Hyphomonas sp.]